MPSVVVALPSASTIWAKPSIEPAAASTPSTPRIWSTRRGVDPLLDVGDRRCSTPAVRLDDDVDALVAGGEEPVEGLAHGVGEDHRPRHEGHAEDDGEAGEHEAHLVGPEALASEVEHGDLPSEALHAVQDGLGGGVEQLVDDVAVGEEDDAVGVGRGDGVVGDHHDGLAELPHGQRA